MEDQKETDDNSLKVESSKSIQPLRNTKRLKVPAKKLRLKQAAKEILLYLTVQNLTPKEIASRRKCTLQAVYKVMKKLKQKGLYDSAFNLNRSTQPFIQPLDHQIRLHGQEWNIKIIQKSEKYKEARNKANTIVIDGNTVRLYQESLEIYSGMSFFEKDEHKATALSLAYLQAFLCRLEHDLGVILIKPRTQNINLVNQHYAETDSDVAWDAKAKGERWRFETDDDGKIFCLIDNSFNLNELETIHPETAKQDMTKIRKQLLDWRRNDPPTNSELADNIKGLILVQENHEKTMVHLDHNLKTHFDVLNNIKSAVQELTVAVRGLKK